MFHLSTLEPKMGIWQLMSSLLPGGEDSVPAIYLLGQMCLEGLTWSQRRNSSGTVAARFTVFASYRER